MDTYQARSIWDRYVNQDPRDYIEFSEFFKAFEDGRLDLNQAVADDVNDYISQLDKMFPGENISEQDVMELREAMKTILSISYESA
jgi:hypothetical protein